MLIIKGEYGVFRFITMTALSRQSLNKNTVIFSVLSIDIDITDRL